MSVNMLEGAFLMFNDMDKLDPQGINGFSKAFRSQIQPPNKIVKEFKEGTMNLAASATSYIFWTIFLVATVIIVCLGYVEILDWSTAIIIIVIIGFLILLMASLLYNRVHDYITRANKEIHDHIADYTSGMFENFVNAFKSGVLAYAEERSAFNDIDPMEAEIYE